MGYDLISAERSRGILILTLADPQRMNPVSAGMLREVSAALSDLGTPGAPAIVIITGQGRAFSAGADLKEYVSSHANPDELQDYLDLFRSVLAKIETSDAIFVAAVNGVCVAGGLEIMLACDLAYAASSARIGDGHANFAQMAGAGGSQRLPRIIGERKAKELMFFGKLLGAAEARAYGLVNDVLSDDGFLNAVIAEVSPLTEKSPRALALMKRMIALGRGAAFEAALSQEIAWAHDYMAHDPHAAEGLAAFLEKRKPVYP